MECTNEEMKKKETQALKQIFKIYNEERKEMLRRRKPKCKRSNEKEQN